MCSWSAEPWLTAKNTRVLDVRLRVGPVHKAVRVFGNRRWERAGSSWRATPPEPFEHVPLRWELSFGGRAAGDGVPPKINPAIRSAAVLRGVGRKISPVSRYPIWRTRANSFSHRRTGRPPPVSVRWRPPGRPERTTPEPTTKPGRRIVRPTASRLRLAVLSGGPAGSDRAGAPGRRRTGGADRMFTRRSDPIHAAHMHAQTRVRFRRAPDADAA